MAEPSTCGLTECQNRPKCERCVREEWPSEADDLALIVAVLKGYPPSMARADAMFAAQRLIARAAPAGMGPSAGARPLSEWHEDDGPVTWWKFPVDEPAWIGTPNSSDWPGYHTHWTPHPPMPLGVPVAGKVVTVRQRGASTTEDIIDAHGVKTGEGGEHD